MAGPDAPAGGPADAPAVILVEPQLGENIGTAARAMMNCGLSDLRLVNPRDGWPSETAVAASSGAEPILEAARVYDSAAAALEGLHHVYATTARPRDMNKPVLGPREAGIAMRRAEAAGARNGILFGKESKGLHNDDVVLAGTIIEARLNPAHTSLNLAQAVLLVGWEWWCAGPGTAEAAEPDSGAGTPDGPALQSDLLNMFAHLEGALDEAGHFIPAEKRPVMVRNLRNIFHRADLTDSEIRGLRGVIESLSRERKRRR
ncbi:MAG: RNA methyltransferase [Rhodospirillaceae bacterium]|nr:RNA methyltransferase [Rhodospirillaceae bacterium]MYF85220.1 RNA methyltransferase [Rhodospirillaceae bacterium]MYH36639.1 RNA methyltransferase [Rhodospirillaceae bacterium]MYK13455.1 RNA methyltransferase [Rhodospirillaceae bacterium]MYK57454.1 RNA methyltransferase [Rhodospirillaceae bacterium]